ncbi:cyclic peptide export ABC transporter [Desulfococcaceae bacterium HSG9]|nr:cyclic peptide export ABC transporter [Desulfococcaceae bacterium HSG9]
MKIKDILKSDKIVALKPIIPLAALSSLCDVAIVVLLYHSANLAYEQPKDQLFILFMLTFILYIITFRAFTKRLTAQVEVYIARIRLTIMERIRNIDLRSFEKLGGETIYTALTYDVKHIAEISHLVVFTIKASISMLICTICLTFLSWSAFFLAASVAVAVGGFYVYNQLLIKKTVDRLRTQEDNLFAEIKHLLDGFKELKLNDRKNDDFFHSGIKSHCTRLRQLNLNTAQRYINNYSLAFGSWKALIVIIVLVLPLVGFFSGNMLLTFIGIILFMPVTVLIEIAPRFFMASFSLQRLFQLEQTLAQTDQDIPKPASPMAPSEFKEIKYDHIRFCYEQIDERSFTLGPFNLTIRAGQTIFITGGNGSGKSTLLKVIIGLYAADSGKTFLNGQDINIYDHQCLFSIVFTDYHLFDRLYGFTDIDKARVDELLKLMQLDALVQFTDGKFSTSDLSVGQKKRMALIVAILEDKPIFVFDEWAADQDPYFKRYFYEELLAEFKAQGKTVIAVTHDDRFFNVADRIFRLDYGRLF